MRDVLFLGALGEVSILMQYLYLDEGHAVDIVNGIGVPLRVSMGDDGTMYQQNMNFPDLPPLRNNPSPAAWAAMAGQLKEQPAKDYPDRFSSRWEEIVELTKTNLCLNRRE